jgi:hypothetical protein
MSRRRSLTILLLSVFAGASFGADDQALWNEYGLVQTETGAHGKLHYTAYRMKDLTDALAVWEWQRSSEGKPCDQAPYCTQDGKRTVIFDNNWVVAFDSPSPQKADVDAVLQALPNKTDSTLPAILTFLPRDGLVADSARYILGKESLARFAPELSSVDPGFAQGVEGQVAEYTVSGTNQPARLAVFYYASPEMARLRTIDFKRLTGTHVKRSGVLVAVVFGNATEEVADTLLSRVQYEAKITWNDSPPLPPLKPLYVLLLNIIYASIVLSGICLLGGLIYAGMRIYRRRYGQLEADEAMTTLHLSGH